MALNLIVWPIFRVMLVLTFASSMLSQTSIKYNEKEKSDSFNQNLSGDLRMEDIMHQINRIKRATRSYPGNIIKECGLLRKRNSRRGPDFPNYQQSSVFLLMNDTGRCVVSADKASHYCGDIEVTAPPFPPPEAGQCHFSTESGREICWPRYEDLDTTCTDVGSGMVSAPAVKHAAIRAMAFVPPDNLRRLVRQYYRQKNSFLFALYECDYGYEFVDEVNSMFCINRQWVITPPKCRGKGLCEADNGGCSHSCLSVEDREVECRCPHGLVLDSDKKPALNLSQRICVVFLAVVRVQPLMKTNIHARVQKEKNAYVSMLRDRPKIYIEPAAPYEIMPGGNLNITCSAVSYPFPQIFWQRGDETVDIAPVKPGTVRSEQILIIKELYKNTQFTCHANNSLGKAERTIEIIVTGGLCSMGSPIIMNRPVISYTVYYTSNSHQPIKNWKKINVDEPNREITIKDLRPNTQYFIRLRANDKLGPGRLSNPVSLNTRKPATRPQLFIQEGETIYVGPLKKFSISCNVTRETHHLKLLGTRARPINKPQRKKFITMEHGGLYESTNFSCVAENEAGRTTKRIKVIVTGPTSPERIRYQINGNNVDLQWEPPRITNGPLKDYEVLYTDNPNLSEEYWETAKAGSPDARSLWIPNLKEKKDYTFKIRAHNDLGSGLFSDQFTLTTWLAARPPVVTITPAEKIVKDPSNEELAFECEAIGVPKPKILWLWSGGLVEDGKNEFRIYDVTPPDAQDRSNSKLIAEKTNRAGVATCQAVNAHGSDEKRTEVKIIGPGSPPRDISTIPFTNSFKVSWNPPKYPNGKIIRYIIYYTKNPDDILGDWEKTTVEGDQLEITISADEDTPYSVRVQAATKDGPGIISEVYDVTTGKKPVPLSVKLIILDPQVKAGDTETIVEPLKAIIFKCDAKGRPAPQISYTWLPFNESESGQEPVPIPAYSDPQEAHRYYSLDVNTNTATKRALMCNARNPDGSVSDQHIFNVLSGPEYENILEPGSAPENIQAIIDPDSRVTISWHEPKYPNGPIIKYKVYVTSDPAEPISYWRIYDAEPSEAPHLILERGELQPETPYYVRIAAVGQAGEGLQSDIVLFETVSGESEFDTPLNPVQTSILAPVDAPKDVLATVEHDNTMDISWTGPSVPNGPIQAYTVYFTPLDHHQTSDDAYKQWDKIVVQSSDNSGMLRLNKDAHDILPNQLYRIRVSATNDLSEGPASEPITVKTESGGQAARTKLTPEIKLSTLETPPIIRLEPTDNPVTIAPYGSISVRCTATGIPPPIVMWIIGTNASDVIRGPILQLTDLRKDETAICKAENNAGQVQEVLQILVAGPGSPPNEIVAFPLDNQQANIEWTTPDFPNRKIIDYIIHYSEVFDKETIPRTWETIRVSAEEPQKYRLTGLKPKTNYAVRLQAISDRGPGVLSDPIKMTTLPLAPAIVQPADVKVHENNTIAIQFDAPRDPEDPGKPIKEFVVQYTDDDPSSNDAQWKEMFWTEPDDDFSVNIPIGGEHFKPDTKYSIRVTARGEIDSLPSEPFVFQTGDGIIPPEKPQINIDVPDNIIRVPAGSDYTVGCASSGFPAPRPLSDGPMLRLQDVKETIKAKCVAENEGGRAETAFEIFVTGPGNAPSNIHLNSVRPRTIHIDWDPPTIPNGNITRYIIYYTPLDDQPITEWMTSHKDREPLNAAPQRADLIDFIEPDTAYAVVLQAVNQDGPGPYSEQHTIRTMSRAREGPPLDLKVEPEGQRSANVEWHKPITSEQPPIGYELYYIKADAKIWENDLASIDDWNMIPITEKDGDKLYYKIDGSLEPDTEYVFRMRAVYPDGPGVFSDACITKTLPDGNAPYILISNGDHGVEGKTEIMILPGSALDLSCNATGQPRPAVKWIRSGYYPIDPAWVKADEKYAIWFLKVSNITEDTSFNCVAQSPLGFANWTINVRLAPDLLSTWKNDFIIARNENGEVVIHFTDDLPDYLKGPHNPWNIYWTDNPSKPFETWNLVPSDNRLLDRIAIPEMEPGTKYHLVIEQPSAGIKTPVFDIMTPKPASEIRVGTDINGEMVLDFKPALATEPIKKYIIKYWPDDNPSAVMYMETPVNITDKIVLDGLQPDAEYNFMVSAKFDNGDNLPSEPAKIRTPSGDIQCHCAHACMFEEDEEGVITASCYCHNGFKLSDDKKSCEHIEEDEEGGIVQAKSFDDLVPKSEKFDKKTEILKAEDEQLVTTGRELVSSYISPLPIDSKDRVLSPIISFDGEPLPTNEYGQTVDNLGNPIVWDDEGRPIGPNGFLLPRNDKGEYIYPIIGKNAIPKNKEGLHIDQYGQIIPTDIAGRPMSVDGSPYPTDEQDELGRIIYPVSYPDGILLATMEDGRFVDEHGQLIPTNDAGLPINEQDKVLPKDSEGNFVYVGNYVLPTDSDGQPVKVQYNGKLLKSDKMGRIIGPDGKFVPTNNYGHPVDESHALLSTTSDGIFLLPVTDGSSLVIPEREQKKRVERPLNIIGPDGDLLPTMEDGGVLDPFGKIIPTNNIGEPVNYRNEPLPTNNEGQAIYPKDGLDCPLPPTDQHGRPVYSVVGPDGRLLPRKQDGTAVDPDGNLLPTNAAGVPVDRKGRPLPTDRNGSIIYPARGIDTEPLPTDSNGKPVYPVIGFDGNLLPTDRNGRVIDEEGRPLPTNAAGEPLPFDQNGYIRYLSKIERPEKPEYIIIGINGEPLPHNEDRLVIGPDNKPIPTDAAGYPVDHRGRLLPRDRNGNFIYPANGIDAEPMPTDRNGRPVYLVIGPNGRLLPKDSHAAVIDISGKPIPTNAAGVPLDHSGKPLSVDRNGYVIYPKESYATDRSGIPAYTILGPDGAALQQNNDGAIVDPYGRPIPTDHNGYPIDNHGRSLLRDRVGNFIYPLGGLDVDPPPTDVNGRPVYPLIGPNGELLPRGSGGDVLDPYGRPVPTNAVGIPVNSLGEPLPKDKSGNVIYPAGGLDVPSLPTDIHGRPIYEIIDSNGELLLRDSDGIILDRQGKPIPTNAAGVPVDRYGRPLKQTNTGKFMYPMEEIYGEEDKSEKHVYPVIGPDRELLPQNDSGYVVDPFRRPIPTNEYGQPVDSSERPLSHDKAGVVIQPATGLDVEPKPTDRSGKPIYPITGPDGHPLPTTADGDTIGPDGNIVPVNAAGVPTNRRGEPLPRDKYGNFIYPATGLDVEPRPTDRSGKPIYPITGPDGHPLPTTADGDTIGPDGNIVPVNAAGVPTNRRGEPLPRDKYGNFIYPATGLDVEPRPTDRSGKPIYPITGPDGHPLPTTADGDTIGPDGNIVPVNAAGVPTNRRGEPLPRDKYGNFIYPATGLDVEPRPTDRSGKPIYPITGPDGHPLPTTADGDTIGPDGNIVPVNAAGVPTNRRGEPLPRDKYGNFIYPATGLDVEPRPTDRSGKPIYPITGPDGHPLPTTADGDTIGPDGNIVPVNAAGVPTNRRGEPLPRDKYGNFIYPATGLDVEPRPTDRSGKPIYPITGPDGHPLPTTADGDTIGPDGNIVPVNAAGVPTNRRGEPLPRDKYGNFIYPATGLDVEPRPTDRSGKPIYPITGPDGHPLPTTADGDTIGPDGNIVPVNAAGVPTNRRGEPLPRDKYGNFIYPATGLDVEPRPTDRSGKPIYPITGPDGHPLPTTADGDTIGPDGNIVPVNAAGVPTNRRGEPLPRDKYGNFIYPATGLDVEPRPTDRSGKPIYPITGPDGHPLPTTADGDTIGPDGNIVPVNAAGVPTNRRGEPLPRDKYGNFIYPATGLDVEPRPTDRSGKPIYPITGPDGHPLPTTADGDTIGPDGNIVPVNAAGVPTNRRGEPLPRDKYGNFIYPATGLDVEPRPTDRSGKPIYPITGPDGHPLPTTADGDTIGPDGNIVPVNAAGVPTNRRGEPLPRDKYGNFIYPATGLDVEPRPTDRSGKPIYPITGPDGHPLPTTADGDTIGPDGNIVPVNAAGVPTNRRGEPLPRDKYGNFIYPATGLDVEPRPTDRSGKPIYPITGPDGHPLPTTADGDTIGPDGNIVPVNAAGVPTNRRGEPLPRDKYGNFIYPATGLDVEPRPTDRSGKPIYPITGPDGHPLPTTADGDTIGPDGNIVPVNAAGVPTNRRGEPLPRDKYGNFIYPATGLDVEPRPTDRSGKPIYPITGPDGHPLPTTADGDTIGPDGNIVPVNAAGVPTNRRGEPLPRDKYGNFIYPATGLDVEPRPTDRSGKPIYPITGPDGHPLPTTADGDTIGPDGNIVPVNAAGVPTNRRGEPLPRDKYGNFIYPFKGLEAEVLPTDSSGLPIYLVIDSYGQILPTNDRGLAVDNEGKPLPTNAAGVPIDEYGRPLPTDSDGYLIYGKVQKLLSTEESDELIYPIIEPDSELQPTKGINIELLPTDSNGRPVYPVVGADHELLPTNEDGAVVDKNGKVIPTNVNGIPVDEKGIPLPTDENGRIVYQESIVEAYPTDRLGRRIYKVIGPDGYYLSVDIDSGDVMDPQGRLIPTDESGNLVDMEGRPLPKDRDGNIIYIAKGLNAKPLPTDRNGKPIYSIMGPNKVPLPTNEEGRFVDEVGKLIPTNAAGVPIGNDGKSLPTEVEGNMHYFVKLVSAAPVVVSRRPVKEPEGIPLPTSSNGTIFRPDEKSLLTDQSGWPLDKERKHMPTGVYNNITYPVKLPDSSVLPTDSHGKLVYPVIGPNGELLPTTENGLIIGLNGSPLSTNAAGKPIGPDASLLPTDEVGRIIHLPSEEPLSTFATNEYDKDNSGAFITRNGIPVELNENHLPIDPDDTIGRASYPVIGPNGQLLGTDSSGAIIGPDGELLPTNKFGMPVGIDGKPLPKDNEGRFVL
ncbi:Mesocentin [Dirofilaria immitis]|nr:Mesocentin [Dirofilaria immitis]